MSAGSSYTGSLTLLVTPQMRTQARSLSTVNRDMVPLRAALRCLLPPGLPNTDSAWQETLKPAKGAVNRRDLYLAPSERKRLVAKVNEDAKAFVTALCVLPSRPGAVAALKVSDFDKHTRAILIRRDKAGKQRQIVVPPEIANFFTQQCEGKLPSAPLFTRLDGNPVVERSLEETHEGGGESRRPSAECNGLYSAAQRYHRSGLRRPSHPYVAQMADTSVAMIEKHYGHLVRTDAEEALASLDL
jgi:integrase